VGITVPRPYTPVALRADVRNVRRFGYALKCWSSSADMIPLAQVTTRSAVSPTRVDEAFGPARHIGKGVVAAIESDRVTDHVGDRLDLDLLDLSRPIDPATLPLRTGANPKEVSIRAGHSSVAFTLDRYGHLYEDAEDEIPERLDALYNAHNALQACAKKVLPMGSIRRDVR
jgi:hypothetical protein